MRYAQCAIHAHDLSHNSHNLIDAAKFGTSGDLAYYSELYGQLKSTNAFPKTTLCIYFTHLEYAFKKNFLININKNILYLGNLFHNFIDFSSLLKSDFDTLADFSGFS